MKIKILTLPLIVNYGGILQAYALQTVLQRMGHEVSVIDREKKPKLLDWIFKVPGRLFQKYVLHQNLPVFHEKLYYNHTLMRAQYTTRFIESHIRRRMVNSLSELSKNEMDALVVGSDQIWRPVYFTPFYGNVVNAFGAFADHWNIRRLSYAASFGVDHLKEYSANEISEIGRILSTFSGVSVRESSGIHLCKDYFHVVAQQVLDPTMLLKMDDYLKLIPDTMPKQEGVMTYVLDSFEGKDEFLNRLGEQLKMPLFSVIAESYEKLQPPLEQWLAGFRDASLIVTDSFHACVFSILFNKPFWVVLNSNRGIARIESLLSMFGLENRLVTDLQTCPVEKTPIDWQAVNQKLEQGRKHSTEYLINALES